MARDEMVMENMSILMTNWLMLVARQWYTKLWKDNFYKIAEERKFSTSLSSL